MADIEVTRGSLVECCHKIHGCIINSDGEILAHIGNYKKIVYARSSAKPIQTIQVIKSGAIKAYNITDEEIALMCSSHSGQKMHVDLVSSILDKANIDESKLDCGVSMPFDVNSYVKLKEDNENLTIKHNTCSGKHSGMLISAKILGEDLDSYLDINHPVQQRILDDIARVCDYNREDIIIGIDGCGAPVHALPLYKIAYGAARLSDPSKLGDLEAIVDKITTSMTTYPMMVGGENRFCSELMDVCNGRIFGKLGAQGFYLIGDKKNKLGIALKVEDGSVQAVECGAVEMLRQFNLITNEELNKLNKFINPKLKNARGEVIGEMTPQFKLDIK